MRLCKLTFTIISSLPCLHTFWHSIPTSGPRWGTLGHVPWQLQAVPHQCRADSSVVDRESVLNGLDIEQRSIAMYIHRITSLIRESSLRYDLRTDLGGCKIPKFSGGGGRRMPLGPPISFCTSRGSSYKRSCSVPMLCPSIGDVLATPLPRIPVGFNLHTFVSRAT